MFPLAIFASLTRVLSEAEQGALGGEREWGLVPEIPVGTSLRRTPDQRLLIRNSAWYVYGAAIFNGVGMALGAASGTLLADLAVGAESEMLRDVQSLPQASWHPPPPLLKLGVRPVLAWMHRQARAEI